MSRHLRPVSLPTRLAILRLYPLMLVFAVASVLIAAAMFLLYSAIFSFAEGDAQAPDYDKIIAEGITTEGTITDITEQTNVTINNNHPSIIAYSYSHDGDLTHDTFTTLAPDKVWQMSIGDTITVQYLDNASTIVGLEPFKFPFNIIIAVVSTPFAIAAIVFIIILLVRIQKLVKLYRYGEVKDATVISITPSGLALVRQLEVYYQYTTHLGPMVGKSLSNDQALQYQFKYGNTIKIFVSPNDESQSCVIPRHEATRNHWQID